MSPSRARRADDSRCQRCRCRRARGPPCSEEVYGNGTVDSSDAECVLRSDCLSRSGTAALTKGSYVAGSSWPASRRRPLHLLQSKDGVRGRIEPRRLAERMVVIGSTYGVHGRCRFLIVESWEAMPELMPLALRILDESDGRISGMHVVIWTAWLRMITPRWVITIASATGRQQPRYVVHLRRSSIAVLEMLSYLNWVAIRSPAAADQSEKRTAKDKLWVCAKVSVVRNRGGYKWTAEARRRLMRSFGSIAGSGSLRNRSSESRECRCKKDRLCIRKQNFCVAWKLLA